MNFTKEVINWYSINKRNLPWRQTNNPYFIWLSEIILQQTQVNQGLPYYLKFIEAYPTVFDLANSSEEDILKLWQGLGYYSRARNLHIAAKYVVNECNGVFPSTYKALLKLKGVGDYTASAIASISFNEPTAVVDGNVYRVLSRYFGIHTPINSTSGIKEFKALAQSLIDTEDPATFNQAIMEFGSKQCKPQNPDCGICPLNSTCIALNMNQINTLPVKISKTKVKNKYYNYLVCIDSQKQTFFEKRSKKGIWQNLYQFPLVETKTAINEDEFLNVINDIKILKDYAFDFSLFNERDVIHKLSHQHLHTKFWIVEIEGKLKQGVLISELDNFPTSVLIANFIEEFNFEI